MSQWTERVENHAVQGSARTLAGLIDEARKQPPTDPVGVTALARIDQIHRHVQRLLKDTDPNITNPNILDPLHSAFSQQINELSSYNSNKNWRHLVNANSHADSVVTYLIHFPRPLTRADLSAVREAVDTTRGVAEATIASLKSESDTLRTQLQELTQRAQEVVNDVQSQKGRLDAAISAYQSSAAQAEQARQAQFTQAEKERASRGEIAAKEQAEEWDKFEAVVQEQRKELFASVSADVDELTNTLRRDTEALEERLRESAAAVLSEMESGRDRAKKILGIISESGLIHGFQKSANEERSAARTWHGVALVAMLGVIGFAVAAFMATLGASPSWGAFGARAFVVGTFGILLAYAARQATSHREEERRFRRLELELAALDPFIEPLPDSERHQVKKQMVERLFGQSERGVPADSQVTGTVLDLFRLMKETIEVVRR